MINKKIFYISRKKKICEICNKKENVIVFGSHTICMRCLVLLFIIFNKDLKSIIEKAKICLKKIKNRRKKNEKKN